MVCAAPWPLVLRISCRSSRIGAVMRKLAVLGSCDPSCEREEGRESEGVSAALAWGCGNNRQALGACCGSRLG